VKKPKRCLLIYFAQTEGKVREFKGYMLLDSATDPQEVVSTYWAYEEDTDGFYKSETCSSFKEKANHYLIRHQKEKIW
jgi:hypothetical protein